MIDSNISANLDNVHQRLSDPIVVDYVNHLIDSSLMGLSLGLVLLIAGVCLTTIFWRIARSSSENEDFFGVVIITVLASIAGAIMFSTNLYNLYCYESAPQVYAAQYLRSFK